MKSVTVLPNQTLSDIAIQEYGTLEAVLLLAKQNGISPTSELTSGSKLKVPDIVIDRDMEDYCKSNRVSPATSESSETEIRLKIFTEQFTKEFT